MIHAREVGSWATACSREGGRPGPVGRHDVAAVARPRRAHERNDVLGARGVAGDGGSWVWRRAAFYRLVLRPQARGRSRERRRPGLVAPADRVPVGARAAVLRAVHEPVLREVRQGARSRAPYQSWRAANASPPPSVSAAAPSMSVKAAQCIFLCCLSLCTRQQRSQANRWQQHCPLRAAIAATLRRDVAPKLARHFCAGSSAPSTGQSPHSCHVVRNSPCMTSRTGIVRVYPTKYSGAGLF